MKSVALRKPGGTVFYGYIVVGAALLIMTISSGAFFSFSVFFAPLQEEFGWSRALTSSAFSLQMVVQGILSIWAGRLNDRFGPRVILSVCSVILGVGFVLISKIDAIWQMYLLYGVVIGAGMSGAPVALMSTVARWFRTRRGMMTGIVMAGVGAGTMFMPPLANWLIDTIAWRSSFVVVGILVTVVMLLAAQFLRRDPARMGLQPLGGHATLDGAPPTGAMMGLVFSEAARTRQFWLLLVAFAGFGFSVHSVLVHIVVHAIGLGLPPASAAGIMIAIGGLGMVGRVGIGSLADRLGSKRLLVTQFGLLSLSLFLLAFSNSAWTVFAFLFGFSFGGIVPLNSHIVAELFGLRSHGSILGSIGFSIGMGSAIGPLFTGYCYDVLGSYLVPFLTCAAVAAASGLLISMVGPVSVKAPHAVAAAQE
jgi:MFS family permease